MTERRMVVLTLLIIITMLDITFADNNTQIEITRDDLVGKWLLVKSGCVEYRGSEKRSRWFIKGNI